MNLIPDGSQSRHTDYIVEDTPIIKPSAAADQTKQKPATVNKEIIKKDPENDVSVPDDVDGIDNVDGGSFTLEEREEQKEVDEVDAPAPSLVWNGQEWMRY